MGIHDKNPTDKNPTDKNPQLPKSRQKKPHSPFSFFLNIIVRMTTKYEKSLE